MAVAPLIRTMMEAGRRMVAVAQGRLHGIPLPPHPPSRMIPLGALERQLTSPRTPPTVAPVQLNPAGRTMHPPQARNLLAAHLLRGLVMAMWARRLLLLGRQLWVRHRSSVGMHQRLLEACLRRQAGVVRTVGRGMRKARLARDHASFFF